MTLCARAGEERSRVRERDGHRGDREAGEAHPRQTRAAVIPRGCGERHPAAGEKEAGTGDQSVRTTWTDKVIHPNRERVYRNLALTEENLSGLFSGTCVFLLCRRALLHWHSRASTTLGRWL